MKPGDYVRRRNDDAKGRVVGLEDNGDTLLVRIPDEEVPRRWGRRSVVVIAANRAPRGLVSVPDRARAATRLYAEGSTAKDVALVYRVSVGTVRQWLKQVRDAERDTLHT